MQNISGRVSKFLPEPAAGLSGLVLEGGREICFLQEYRLLVNAIAKIGTKVEIQGFLIADSRAGGNVGATRITNRKTRQSICMEFPDPLSKPGMLMRTTPAATASLAPSEQNHKKYEESHHGRTVGVEQITAKMGKMNIMAQSAPAYLRELLLEHAGHLPDSLRMEAAAGIGHAYDLLHRVQAILAYLHIMKRQVPGISQFLDESKRTYEQALSQFGNRDFAGARELAGASGRLSCLVELVMARTLRADTSFPSLVPPPPEHRSAESACAQVEEGLAATESILSRVHWLLENGTLPLVDRDQIRKIATWADAFYKQAQKNYISSDLQGAAELVEASLAAAYAAEHICRRWYLGQSSHQETTGHALMSQL